MTKEHYTQMTEPFRRNPKLAQQLHIINKALSILVAVSYLGLLATELYCRNPVLARNIIVPLDSFIILSVFRFFFNRKRPYEVFEMKPVIPKETSGKSFPSRHVFSAFMIAVTFLFSAGLPWMGAVLLLAAAGIAVIRVISGVHFISDVVVGALWGILTGIIGYLI